MRAQIDRTPTRAAVASERRLRWWFLSQRRRDWAELTRLRARHDSIHLQHRARHRIAGDLSAGRESHASPVAPVWRSDHCVWARYGCVHRALASCGETPCLRRLQASIELADNRRLAQALRPSPHSVMKNASATTGNARPTHAASVHPPAAYAQPPRAEPTAPPMKKAAT